MTMYGSVIIGGIRGESGEKKKDAENKRAKKGRT